MKLARSIAEKLFILAGGEQLPASSVKHQVVTELIEEGIVLKRISGRTKMMLYVPDAVAMNNWLYNKYGINDLEQYIQTLGKEDASRADLVNAANNTKLKSIRSFKGFMVNSCEPVNCMLNGDAFVVHPPDGSFQFIYDFEDFVPPKEAVMIGIENAENFRNINRQRHLFPYKDILFICRYPQEQARDMLRWLLSIPNNYVHFGDFDFAGINIYEQEYRKHLGDRAAFFVPENIEELLQRYGNTKLYDIQELQQVSTTEESVSRLIALLHKYKKGLEQEALLIQ